MTPAEEAALREAALGEVRRAIDLLRKARRLAEMVDGPDGVIARCAPGAVVEWWAEELDAEEVRRLCAEIIAETEEATP